MAYAKINSVTNANMAKVSSAAKAALGKITSIDAPSASFSWSDDKSLDFDGTDDHVAVSYVSALNPAVFTVSCWAKAHTDDRFGGLVVSRNAVTFLGYQMWAWNDQWRFLMKVGNTYYNAWSTTNIALDTWVHVALTYDDSNMKIYVDGSNESTTAVSGASVNDGTSGEIDDLIFGGTNKWGGIGYTFDGLINDVAIYDTALDASAISAIYNSGTPTDLSDEDNLIGYWVMGDSDTYPTITDRSTNSNNGTMTNMVSGDIVTDSP